MKPTYFQGNYLHPQHVSVGAVLVNKNGEVCAHHFLTKDLKGYWSEEGIDDFFILMRETVEPGESLEATLHRGLQEEFGATGEIVDYLGSIQSHFKHRNVEIEKTTLYFLVRLLDQDLARRGNEDIENKSTIEWQTPEFLIPRMKEQAKKFGRTDIDESSILERWQQQPKKS